MFIIIIFLVILFYNTLVIGHESRDFNDIRSKLPDVKDEGLWTEYGKHGFMHDLNHLKEEANKLLYMQESEQISVDQSAFYYTRLHDFNNDGGLDGLELLFAIKHSLVHHNSSYESVNLENFSNYVDSELNLMDLNNDGLVDYGEIYTYMENIKKNSSKDDEKEHKYT